MNERPGGLNNSTAEGKIKSNSPGCLVEQWVGAPRPDVTAAGDTDDQWTARARLDRYRDSVCMSSLHFLSFFCPLILFSCALSLSLSLSHDPLSLFIPSSSLSFSHLLSRSLSSKHSSCLFLPIVSSPRSALFLFSVPARHIFIQLLSIKNGLDFTYTVCPKRKNKR